jgi:hypothetical protein
MVPSLFIVLEQFPLNANGKLDRQRLPTPNFSLLATDTRTGFNVPYSKMEERVHDLWCQVLHHDGGQIPTTASFFSIGGHSLLLIQLYHCYQLSFDFDSRTLTIAPFLRQTTIAGHAQLLETVILTERESKAWQPLYINQGNTCFEMIV